MRSPIAKEGERPMAEIVKLPPLPPHLFRTSYPDELRAWRERQGWKEDKIRDARDGTQDDPSQAPVFDPIHTACMYWIYCLSRVVEDPAMIGCSLGAQAFWLHLLLIMSRSRGLLLVNGQKPNLLELSRMVRISTDDFLRYWREIERTGITSVTEDGILICRLPDDEESPS